MTSSSFTIRTMDRAEVDLAVDWAAAEGWNPGLDDAASFFAADPQGFLIGLEDGEPVGCISAVRYGPDYGFIGFYIVKPAWRGRGLGIRLWDAAIKRLAERTVGLDGVLAQQGNYQKSGFALSYRNIRYAGIFDQRLRQPRSPNIVPVSEVNKTEIAAYDTNLFFTARPDFLQAWLNQPSATALAYRVNEQLTGYGVVRKCRLGYKIGPLFADSAEIGQELLVALAEYAQGEQLFFDVPEVNSDAVALAESFAIRRVFETARMYKGPAPQLDTGRIFGVTTFELG